jgi:hypothetical protein
MTVPMVAQYLLSVHSQLQKLSAPSVERNLKQELNMSYRKESTRCTPASTNLHSDVLS